MSQSLLILAATALFSLRGAAQIVQWDTLNVPRGMYHLTLDARGELFAAGDTALYTSTDDGLTWNRIGPVRALPHSLSADTSGALFVGNDALGIFRTTDNGAHWTGSLVTEGCNALAMHPNGFLFAGLTYTGNGKVHRSTDHGDSWTAVPLPHASGSFATECFAFSGNAVYAGSIDGFYRSTDFGVSWTQSNNGFAAVDVREMAVAPNADIYTMNNYPSSSDGLYRSTSGGESWQRVSSSVPAFQALACSGSNDLLGVTGTGVFRSTDGGVSWNNITGNIGTFQNLASIVVTPSGHLVVGGYRLFRNRTALTGEPGPGTSSPPADFSLAQNFPNPFNPSTTVRFTLGSGQHVTLAIYDAIGQEVAVLVSGELPPGTFTSSWDATDRAAGAYYCRLQAGSFSTTRQMMLVK